jgi:hypothetical protein
MPKIDDSKKLTASITIKLTNVDYQLARALADRRQVPLAEWVRDRFLEMLGGRGASPSAHAILAEILATQDTIVGLFCAIGRDGRLTQQKVKEIVDAAHNRKYRDVAPLFRCAHTEIETRRRQQLANDPANTAGASVK